MADTISEKVAAITGVSSPSTEYIDLGKKFAIASVPKDILSQFANAGVSITDGSGQAAPDVVFNVFRNGAACAEVSSSMAYAYATSGSLYNSTALFPVVYTLGGNLFIKPDPTVSAPGVVYKVDYSDIGDDTILDNIITFYAAALEFSGLASTAQAAASALLGEMKSDSGSALKDVINDALDTASKFIDSAQTIESVTAHSAGYWINDEDPEMVRAAIEAASQEVQRAVAAGNIMQGWAATISGHLNEMVNNMQHASQYYNWAIGESRRFWGPAPSEAQDEGS